jgi:hypothetical protein
MMPWANIERTSEEAKKLMGDVGPSGLTSSRTPAEQTERAAKRVANNTPCGQVLEQASVLGAVGGCHVGGVEHFLLDLLRGLALPLLCGIDGPMLLVVD